MWGGGVLNLVMYTIRERVTINRKIIDGECFN